MIPIFVSWVWVNTDILSPSSHYNNPWMRGLRLFTREQPPIDQNGNYEIIRRKKEKTLPESENRTHDFLAKLRLKATVKAVDGANYTLLPSLWTKQSFNLIVHRFSNSLTCRRFPCVHELLILAWDRFAAMLAYESKPLPIESKMASHSAIIWL